jgi:hypothetical protein
MSAKTLQMGATLSVAAVLIICVVGAMWLGDASARVLFAIVALFSIGTLLLARAAGWAQLGLSAADYARMKNELSGGSGERVHGLLASARPVEAA